MARAGDSGGPILDATNTQVGLVSWGGTMCADPKHAGVAARITTDTAIPWIEEQICRLSATPPASCNNTQTTSYNHRLPASFDNGGRKKKKTSTVVDDTHTGPFFDIEVSVHHDLAPERTSWSLTHLDSYSLLYWQPYEQVPMPYVTVNRVFSNLVAGTYVFAISDDSGNGICCGYGPGFISITKPHTGEVLWEHWGVFKDQVSVRLQLDATGSVVTLEESDGWINPAELHAHNHTSS